MCSRPPSACRVNSLTGREPRSSPAERPRSRSAWRGRRGRAPRSRSAPRTARRRPYRAACQRGAAGLVREVEDQRALRGVEELEQRAFALRQERRRAAHRIAAGRLDLEHRGAEIGGDLAGQGRGKPQAERHVAIVHLDDREARKREGVGRAHGRVSAYPVLGWLSTEVFHGTDRQPQGPAVRHLPRPFPSGRREPDPGHGARHGAGRMDRRAGLRRGLDRRAPFRRLGDDRVAGGLHRRADRAHRATSGSARA